MAEPIPNVSTLPDQTGEFDDEKYIQTMRYFAGTWNPAIYGFGQLYSDGKDKGANVDDTRYIPYYLRNAAYIFGTQSNANYAFFNLDLRGNQTAVPMFRGLDVKKYFDHYHGYCVRMIDPLPKIINVSASSENALSLKKETLDAAKFALENQDILEIIKMYTGMGFRPVNKDFESMEEADKYFESFQESMEISYHDIAKNIILTNRYKSTLLKPVDYAFIGGRGTLEVYHHNGNIYWKPIDPVCAIYDMSKNDDQHEDDDYGGEMEMYPYTYVIGRWSEKLKAKYGESVIKQIESIAKGGGQGWAMYNNLIGYNGLYWWNNVNNYPHIGVLSMQWRSLRIEDGEEVETLREAVLIGNKWLVDAGETVGQVYDKKKRSRKKLRYRTFSPSTMLKTNIGLAGLICRFADLKDALVTRMVEMVSSSFGKVGYVRLSKLPTAFQTPDFISEMKQNKFIVLEDTDEDDSDNDSRTPIGGSIDLTLDPGIQQILGLIQYFDGMIADMINIPPNVRGQTTTSQYQAERVVQNNQQQANLGMEYYYDNIRQWIEGIVEYSADLAKLIWPEQQREKLTLLIGDTRTRLLEMNDVRKMQFEDFLLKLNFDNAIDDTERAEYRDFIKVSAQQGNPMYKLSNLVKIDGMDTKTEVGNYIESVEYKFEKQQEAIRQQELQMAEIQNQRSNQTQENIANTQADANIETTDRNNEAKLVETLLKGKKESAAA